MSENSFQRQRNPRACEACRGSKSRCFASDEPDICQRCLKAGLTCSVRSVARPRRQKKSALAISQGLNLQNGIMLEEDDANAVYIKVKSLPPLDSRESVSQMHIHHQEMFQKLLPTGMLYDGPITPSNTARAQSTPTSTEVALESGPTHRSISIDEADKLLKSFQEMKGFFPFVTIPEDATVKSLSRSSPFLLLAMLCAASAKDIQLGIHLDHEFKRVLSEKVVCEGRESLDFLQGLLVYIAWYPCHLRPKNSQAFMYINLALSILEDLGIGNRENALVGTCPANVEPEGLFDEYGYTKAAQRTYLGCYYLSSAISMGFQKPNSLKYNVKMEEYGTALGKNPEFWSDISLLALVKCHYIRERIRDSLSNLQSNGSSFDVSPFQAEMNVQAFNNEVEEWKMTMPSAIKSTRTAHMVLAERFITINVFSHDLAFFRPIPEQRQRHLNPVTLSRCLEACKKFFESLLSIPVHHYGAFTNVEWSNIIQSIIILSRLSFPLPRCPGWDVVAAREHAPLGMFLDCLCYRMQALSSVPITDTNPKAPDGPYIFRLVLESIKRSYEQRVMLVAPSLASRPEQDAAGFPTPSGSCSGSSMDKLRCPMNDRKLSSILESSLHDASEAFGSPGVAGVPLHGVPRSIPVYHDLWATMTMNWSDE